MRALLDVNALIALLDCDHTSHGVAMSWFRKHARDGWASCPITQNGCIRIMSNQNYPNALPVRAVMKRLADACEKAVHEFWTDEISLLNPGVVDSTRIHGPRQLTDIYLLALAVENKARFVTFEAGVALAAVRRATSVNLTVL
ncbi:MAG TPA: TA system VapC family ribonuclease toxin [Steroidobacteraceae bacterium]|nr:TA system VapC family ribonuclease toxin [Steroidobacteraceae bacterium]